MPHEFDVDESELRSLEITDEERIERFKRAGYGGNVSDALYNLGVDDTILAQEFAPLEAGMVLCGRALPVKLHSQVLESEDDDPLQDQLEEGEVHPQRRMMETVAEMDDGSVLCFDCGGDMQPAQFGELSCNLAYQQGCRGMVVAGNMRDTQYVLEMDDFPAYSLGTTPNYYGGWIITEVNEPIYLPGHLTHYVEVHPGDFLFGDRDGVQVIPEALVDEVLLRVEETHEKEEDERDRIREGMTVEEVYDEFGVL
ncbi:RraA family protein [Halobacteria archaeon AArc-m2/3/4]|uniref:RraA family protein n=1 Tax=Natronoglomus mannanivorans TaxID=2979990 RepID=A0ABT2QKQ7_9EURY|nr:RraA family protein [Halobacteria archaeon AArc-m2/3/4]